MKKNLLLVTVLLLSIAVQAGEKVKNKHKGKFYFYWGWNRSAYTSSDMSFQGEGYDFSLGNVKATDRQTPFQWDTYFNPSTLSIPQYNMRFGYFFWNNYEVSIGVDHMKYVMVQDQSVFINGSITNSETAYDGEYVNEPLELKKDFLIFEHSDGLNYINASIKRFDDVYCYKMLTIGVSEGIEVGGMMPRTNATLLSKDRNDEFHWAGYGISALGSVRLTLWKHFFIQSEVKGGLVNLPDVRTTPSVADKMRHRFSYVQTNILFGFSLQLLKSSSME